VSLANCRQCAGLLSDAADSCPHCGFPVERPSDESSSVDRDAGATGSRLLTPFGYAMVMAGGAGVLLGSFLPWARLGDFVVAGVEGDGTVTAFFGILILIAGYMARTKGSDGARILALVAGVGAAGVGIYDLNNLKETAGAGVVGSGLTLTIVAAVSVAIGTFMRTKPSSDNRHVGLLD